MQGIGKHLTLSWLTHPETAAGRDAAMLGEMLPYVADVLSAAAAAAVAGLNVAVDDDWPPLFLCMKDAAAAMPCQGSVKMTDLYVNRTFLVNILGVGYCHQQSVSTCRLRSRSTT